MLGPTKDLTVLTAASKSLLGIHKPAYSDKEVLKKRTEPKPTNHKSPLPIHNSQI